MRAIKYGKIECAPNGSKIDGMIAECVERVDAVGFIFWNALRCVATIDTTPTEETIEEIVRRYYIDNIEDIEENFFNPLITMVKLIYFGYNNMRKTSLIELDYFCRTTYYESSGMKQSFEKDFNAVRVMLSVLYSAKVPGIIGRDEVEKVVKEIAAEVAEFDSSLSERLTVNVMGTAEDTPTSVALCAAGYAALIAANIGHANSVEIFNNAQSILKINRIFSAGKSDKDISVDMQHTAVSVTRGFLNEVSLDIGLADIPTVSINTKRVIGGEDVS